MRKIAVLLLSMLLCVTGFVQAQDEAPACEGVLVEHALGATCVPAGVERVVALEWAYVENLLAVGIQPVGVADIENYHSWVQIPQTLDESVVNVGTRQEPNLEQIIALNPDLIITAAQRAANNYDQLSAIAPTLAFNAYPEDGMTHYEEMVQTFSIIAEVTGQAEAGEAVLAGLDAHLEAAADAITEAGRAGETFILAQGWVANDISTFRLFTDNALGVQILEKIGFSNAWEDAPQLYGFTEISYEGFAEVEDTNFFYIAQEDSKLQFEQNAVWNSLPFVQSGRTYWLGPDVWLFGGPISAQVLVDTFVNALGITVAESANAETRIYAHEFGETEIPADPQRIIAADLGVFIPTFGALAAVGVQPVAVTADNIPDYLAEYLEGVTVVPSPVNYETLLGLDADLIITPGVGYNEDNFNNLSLVGTTVAPLWYWQTLDQAVTYWREVGVLVNKEAEMEEVISGIYGRIETLKAELAPRMEGKTVSVFQVQNTGLSSLFLQTGRVESAVLNAIGIERPENQTYDPTGEQWYIQLSTELLNEADAWGIFVEVYADNPEDIDTIKAELEGNALWQSLDAVKNGRVFYVQTDEWSGTDPFVANLIIDAIENNLTAALDAQGE